MRLLLVFMFLVGCENTPQDVVPQKPIEPVLAPEKEKPPKVPDEKVADAFAKPGNLKSAPSQAEVTPTGLKSIQLKAGDENSESPNLNSVITVRFSSWTPDGKSFQKSKEKSPLRQRVGNLLKGWQEGIVKMKKGEIRRFWMPGKLAYDNDPNPNSQKGELIFDIELIGFENKK